MIEEIGNKAEAAHGVTRWQSPPSHPKAALSPWEPEAVAHSNSVAAPVHSMATDTP